MIEQVQLFQHQIKRDGGDDAGKHLHEQKRAQRRVAAGKAEARQRIRRRAGQEHADHRYRCRDHERVEELTEEQPAAAGIAGEEHLAEVAQGQRIEAGQRAGRQRKPLVGESAI